MIFTCFWKCSIQAFKYSTGEGVEGTTTTKIYNKPYEPIGWLPTLLQETYRLTKQSENYRLIDEKYVMLSSDELKKKRYISRVGIIAVSVTSVWKKI